MNTMINDGARIITIRDDLTGYVALSDEPSARLVPFRLRNPLDREDPWYLPVTDDPVEQLILTDMNYRKKNNNSRNRQTRLFEEAVV